ncbi:MAG: fumarylacetoacetate hydrolase family protein [Acidobacteriota bacterium]|nr:fumarylacetoacetate hydrolase family protein [Acidobacteriota bacterium]
MKLVSFSRLDAPVGEGVILPGALVDDGRRVIDLTYEASHFFGALQAVQHGVTEANIHVDAPSYAIDEVRLHAPLQNPPRVFAIGLNYRDHAKESGMEIPKLPVVFFKMTTAIVGPGEAIVLPKNSTEPDYEAEFAFVIGKGGYRIPASAWREHVYGYTIVNDVSARDVQLATSQWSLGKSFPTFCPMGPAIVSADEIEDPHNLDVSLTIDGETMQHSNTRELIFKVPDLVEYISSITPLLPGDVISTGTPYGVGLGRNPKRWLKPGETVTITIEKIGSLTNPTVAE